MVDDAHRPGPRGSDSTASRWQRPPLKSGRCRGGPHPDDDDPAAGGYPRHPGGARELLDHVAEIANTLAH